MRPCLDVGHSNLGFADALREAEQRGACAFRHPPRGRLVRSHAYGKLTGELAACFAIAGPGSTNLMTGCTTPRSPGPVLACAARCRPRFGPGAFQDLDSGGGVADVAAYNQTVRPGRTTRARQPGCKPR